MINTLTMMTMLNDKNDDLSTPLAGRVPIEINTSTTAGVKMTTMTNMMKIMTTMILRSRMTIMIRIITFPPHL